MKFKRFCELAKTLANQYHVRVTVEKDGDKYIMHVPGRATMITSKSLPKFTIKWDDGHTSMVDSTIMDAFIA